MDGASVGTILCVCLSMCLWFVQSSTYSTNTSVFFRGFGGMGCLLELSCLSVHVLMVC